MSERSLAHAGFTLERDYPHPLSAVWAAFAEEDQRREWFGVAEGREHVGEWSFDFRIGGRDVAESRFHDGPVSRYEATFTDIVELERIVIAYDMWIDGTHISTSIASFEFEPIEGGTRFTHGEHGIHFDGFDLDGRMREAGTRGLHDELGRALDRRALGGL
jgi:uncharacterized protein YndB with AHSA1/START domain